MLKPVPRRRSFSRFALCSLLSSAAFTAPIADLSTSPGLRAQAAPPPTSQSSQPIPAWQKPAGDKLEFEVASIRPGDPGRFMPPNVDLSIEDTLFPPGGRFFADFPLPLYIEFAYKILLTREQEQQMVAHLPNWVGTEPFVIEAKVEGSPTKDQIRLMMQSLLADRFKLAVHFVNRDRPALALVLGKPGAPGPRLRLHEQGLACDAIWIAPPDRAAPTVPPGGFVPRCEVFQAITGANHTIVFGARNVTVRSIAANLGMIPPVAQFGRPVVDETSLKGRYDFSLNWLPDRTGTSSGAEESLDAQGPSFEEALRDQLGFKLKPTRAVVQTLVIDRVVWPTPN
jgi:bla regulator protein blaR1